MRKARFSLIATLVLLVLLTACNLSSSDDEKSAAKEDLGASAEGVLSVMNPSVSWQGSAVSDTQAIKPGELIVTDAAGHALLNFFVGMEVEILPNTNLVVQTVTMAQDGTSEIKLEQLAGDTVHSVTLAAGGKSRYVLETPVANLTVRGTEFRVKVDPALGNALHLEVTAGTVQTLVKATGQQFSVQAGQGLDVDAQGITAGPFALPTATATPGATATRPPTLTPGPATPLPLILPTVSIPTQAPTFTPLPTATPSMTPTMTPTIGNPGVVPGIVVPGVIVPQGEIRPILAASFIAKPEQGTVPLRVQFSDTSTGDGIIRWVWSFGDGGTSTDQNPWWTYTKPGSYEVSLTVYNQNGASSMAYGKVDVADVLR